MLIHPMPASSLIARARSACGHQVTYVLGAGGYSDTRTTAWATGVAYRRKRLDGSSESSVADRGCDCTGFLSWAIGIHRKLTATEVPGWVASWGAWLETTNLFRDANSPFGFVAKIPWAKARPGCIMVYGDEGGHQGHVGLVSEVGDGMPAKVVHCSAGNFRLRGDAIMETGATPFLARGIVAEFAPWLVTYDA